ncbi:thiamine phosphate synthase [bacterium]|nr:thiamine phosphate synthase [bacterium]
MIADRLRLVAITNRLLRQDDPATIAAELVAGGATAILLREKDLPPRELYELACRVRDVCRPAGALFLVSQSLEVALAAGADGVHLGWQSVPLERAKSIAPPPFLIGVSAHNKDDLAAAESGDADYAFVSPIHPPRSKESRLPPLGFEGLARLAKGTSLPVVALGGLRACDTVECLQAGCVGIAAIGSLYGAATPRKAAAEFLQA